MHTAGIYADMTVDGPEIGTLVVVMDRAKNLPNRKTMGKQNPYCAARLGKEAKKTDTDQRGGQTPRWDQELRFTVHDSPDYNNLKVSVFNDDKKTDLISEAWISLTDVLQPGGGSHDQWHHLTYKGKYAGEIRMELTYYDTRPRENSRRASEIRDSSLRGRQHSGGSPMGMGGPRQPSVVKRRPLPSPGDTSNAQAATAPLQRMGPRDYSAEVSPIVSSRPLPSTGSSSRPALHDDLPELPQQYDGEYEDNHHLHRSISDEGYDIPLSDDPYALQALEENQHAWDDGVDAPEVSVPRNDRVAALSQYSVSRSLPPQLPHTHSAPLLGPYEQLPQADHAYPDVYARDEYQEPRYDDGYNQSRIPQQDYYNHSTGTSPRAAPQFGQGSSAPPPPMHRNSAPNLPRTIPIPPRGQYPNGPSRALHTSTSITDMSHPSGVRKVTPQRHSYNDLSTHQQNYNNNLAPPHSGYQQPYNPASPPYPDKYPSPNHAYNVSPPRFDQHQTPPFDPRRSGGQADYRNSPNNMRPRPPQQQYTRPYDSPQQPYSPRQPGQGQPQSPHYRSLPQSPAPGQTQTPPYGSPRLAPSHGPGPGPGQGMGMGHRKQPSQPYASTPSAAPRGQAYANQNQGHTRNAASASLSPMPSPHSPAFSPDAYHNPNANSNSNDNTPSHASHQAARPSLALEPDINPLTLAPHSPAALAAAPPIIGADGRVKDPSDHLPLSSYAPEPETKTGRPSIQVNVKNRFGPRALGEGSGNLGGNLGMGGGPPPVPGKVPLAGVEGRMGGLVIGEAGTGRSSVGGSGGVGGGGGIFGKFKRTG